MTKSNEQEVFSVRAAVVGDADAIASLNAKAWKAGFRGVMPDDFLDTRDGNPSQRRIDLLEPKLQTIELVAVREGDNEPIGWLAAHPTEDDDLDPEAVFEIKACYTHPDYWRRGVGRLLVNFLWAELAGSTWEAVILWTPRDTNRSRQFYESVGFVLDGGSKNWNYGVGDVALVRYRRILDVEM